MTGDLLFATSNPHKLEEVRAILEPRGIRVVGLDDVGVGDAPEPEEDGSTFADNARLKARYYAKLATRPCLADDSGLVVDALGGAPGVHSARYAGVGGSRVERDRANNDRLLRELAGVPAADRTARFVCSMCLVDASGSVRAETEGRFEGVVGTEPSGRGGFGYDPLLYLADPGCTVAELTSDEKNARSHRGLAVRALARWLAETPGDAESVIT
ncbi:MAG: RdgB/HAM1 family non-canonical purine NTP pyrophosphatase [Phycisphaerae bacterium]|nr:RdgB/HAM1 family non-canonical purine NTP pyrophosphatase [Phycisphaerae bacterium]NNF43556.1 RdgB/HAM1 family non-canonical purine NTP pyrophosphatase [Phycisphaerales bacterium]